MDRLTFHHFGLVVRDLQTSGRLLDNLLGYKLVSGPFDDPIQKVSVCFLSRGEGDPCIELVAPLGSDSPVGRMLKKDGGPYHICYQVPDMRAAIAHLIDQGSFLLSGPTPAVAFEMKEIAWLMTGLKLLVELVQA